MELVILIGIQATGKSTFYKQHFFNTHVRISLDLLKTRNRESKLFQFCLETGQKCVIDNTNPSLSDRKRYIAEAKKKGFKIIGYYFESKIKESLTRNKLRKGKQNIPEPGILATYNKLKLPDIEEGFDQLFYVSIKNNDFNIQEWDSEI